MALLPISHISLRTLMQRRRLIADAMQHITVHQKKLFQLPEEARPCLTKYCKYIPSSLNGHSRQRAALLFTHSCKRPGSVTDTISAPTPSPPPPAPSSRVSAYGSFSVQSYYPSQAVLFFPLFVSSVPSPHLRTRRLRSP